MPIRQGPYTSHELRDGCRARIHPNNEGIVRSAGDAFGISYRQYRSGRVASGFGPRTDRLLVCERIPYPILTLKQPSSEPPRRTEPGHGQAAGHAVQPNRAVERAAAPNRTEPSSEPSGSCRARVERTTNDPSREPSGPR